MEILAYLLRAKMILIGWLFAVVGNCFLGRITDAVAWFDLWIKMALCFCLYRDLRTAFFRRTL